METSKRRLLRWLVCLVVGALGAGCASSASARRNDAPGDGESAAQQPDATADRGPDESAYRKAAEEFLEFLNEQQRAGANVIHASGKKDGIYPMYECMEYGCPDRVFCEKAGAYCHQKRPQMSLDPVSEKAARIATALNGLGHIAFGHPLEGARNSKGDAELRERFHEDATLVLDLIESEAGSKSPATRRPAECKAALSRFREMVQSIDFDDAASMATLQAYARRALEAFMGETLPETLPE